MISTLVGAVYYFHDGVNCRHFPYFSLYLSFVNACCDGAALYYVCLWKLGTMLFNSCDCNALTYQVIGYCLNLGFVNG